MLTLYSVVTDSVVPEAASCQSVITFFPSIFLHLSAHAGFSNTRCLAWASLSLVLSVALNLNGRLLGEDDQPHATAESSRTVTAEPSQSRAPPTRSKRQRVYNPKSEHDKPIRCEACEILGHKLEDCWYLTPSKRPFKFKATERTSDKEAQAKQRVLENPAWAERWRKIEGKREMKD